MIGPDDEPVIVNPDTGEIVEDVEFEADRALPPPAGASNTQLIFAAGLFLLIAFAVWFLLFRDVGPQGPDTGIVATEETYVGNQTRPAPALPTPPPAPVFTPPAPPEQSTSPADRPTYDPSQLADRRAALEAERRIREAELARMEARLRSNQVIYDGGANTLGAAPGGAAASGLTPEETLLSPFARQALQGTLNGQQAPQARSAANTLGGGEGGSDANTDFYNSVVGGGTPTARSTRLERLDNVLPQGTIIGGVLETAINTDLPGMLRAVVAEDIYSFDGSVMLVPRGSRLIGRYSSSIEPGQSRVFIIWERILRPDGVSIRVDSPGTDTLGTSGLGGDVRTHFFKRFGSAILLSVIEGGLEIAAAEASNGNDATLIIGGNSARRTRRLADRALERTIDIPPTIHVDQGTRINICVAQDLIFDGDE